MFAYQEIEEAKRQAREYGLSDREITSMEYALDQMEPISRIIRGKLYDVKNSNPIFLKIKFGRSKRVPSIWDSEFWRGAICPTQFDGFENLRRTDNGRFFLWAYDRAKGAQTITALSEERAMNWLMDAGKGEEAKTAFPEIFSRIEGA